MRGVSNPNLMEFDGILIFLERLNKQILFFILLTLQDVVMLLHRRGRIDS